MNSLHILNFSLQINEEKYYRPVIRLAPNLSAHVLLHLRARVRRHRVYEEG